MAVPIIAELITPKMIKVSALYPNQPGKIFDIDYYCDQHVPMILELLGDAVKGAAIEYGLRGVEPGSPPTYIAMGHLYFNSIEEYQNSFGLHSDKILADVPNYTDIKPIVQISEVRL